MKNSGIAIALISMLAVAACSSEPSDDLQDSIVESSAISNFDPGNSVIPFPNDLLFSGTADGTLNIPVADAMDFSDPQVALNALDGFSTVAPFTVGFTGPILSSSIDGNSVRLYRVTLSSTPGGAVIAIDSTVPVYGVDYVAAVSTVDSSGSTLAILPLKPLDPVSSYFVVITNSLKSTDGNSMGASGAYTFSKLTTPLEVGGVSQFPALSDAEAVALEPLRQLVSTSVATLLAFDTSLTSADLVMSWSFTTQSIGDVLSAVRTAIRDGGVPATTLADSGTDSPLGAADIYVGTLQVPYYLTAAAGVNDPTPLGSFWQGAGGTNLTRFNTAAVATSTETIPMMVSVPKSAQPPGGYPVVIYQHGITTNRATLLAVADALANGGMAAVAIDMPMHGLTGNETNGTEAFYGVPVAERTFDLDLVTQDASGNITASVPDGVTDTSGRHYINLTNLLNSRDNLRQSVSDLFALTYAIENLTNTGINTLNFDTSQIRFLGHSLGAIVGTVFGALEPEVNSTVFAFGGGYVSKILDGSATFSPAIAAGLAANGVNKGTADYESFLAAAQTVVDSGDAINYAIDLEAKNEGILYFEIVGGNSSPSDLVIPNRVPDGNDSSNTVAAPLAGTEPIMGLMGLTHVATTQPPLSGLTLSVKFIAGSHSSLLDPSVDLAVTTEMQTQMATFLATDGSIFSVADPSVLLPP